MKNVIIPQPLLPSVLQYPKRQPLTRRPSPATGRPAGGASAVVDGRQLPPEHDHHRGGREARPRHRNGPRRRHPGH